VGGLAGMKLERCEGHAVDLTVAQALIT
jgi:hypothetical protein